MAARASTDLARALDAVRARCDVEARRAADPVGFVHALPRADDREAFGLVAASIAFGNVATIRAKLAELLDRIGPRPARAADDPARLAARLAGWKHRVFVGDDVARLLAGARRVQRESGSLGARFAQELSRARAQGDEDPLRGALTARRDRSWRTTGEITRGLAAFDPKDPVKYDFALCHMGMLQRCPSKKDAARCEGCGVKPVCIHWRRR